jgi:hypothetical protein
MTATLPEVITGRPESSADGAGPDSGPRRGASLTERGYVHARFGGMPILVGPELAAQLKAIGQKQPGQ